MSFYGSIYYQLVDAFNKISAKNNGSGNTGKPTVGANIDEIAAVGRQNSLDLETGNAWIQFSPGSGEDPSVVISHGPAVNTNTATIKPASRFTGSAESVIELDYSDVLKIQNFKYDKAGHIYGDATATYLKLPASPPITDDIANLQSYTGIDKNSTLPTNNKLYDDSSFPDPKDNLRNYVIHNYKVLEKNTSLLYDWGGIASSFNWSKTSTKHITVKQAIGTLDDLFKNGTDVTSYASNSNSANNGKTYYTNGLVSCIGNMNDLNKTFTEKNTEKGSTTLVSAICSIYNNESKHYTDLTATIKDNYDSLDSRIINNVDQIASLSGTLQEHRLYADSRFDNIITALIGTKPDNAKALYPEIQDIKTNYEAADQAIRINLGEKPESYQSAFMEIANIYGIIGDRSSPADNTIFKIINNNTSNISKIETIIDKNESFSSYGSIYSEIDKLSTANTTIIETIIDKNENFSSYGSIYSEIDKLSTANIAINAYFANMNKATIVEEIDTRVNTKLVDYVTTDYLSNTLIPTLALKTDLPDGIEDFVSETELTDRIKDFISETELTDRIKDFVSKTDLPDGIEDFVSKEELTSTKEEFKKTYVEISALTATKEDFMKTYVAQQDFISNIDIALAATAANKEGQSQLTTIEGLLNKIVELETRIAELEKTPDNE